MGKVSKKILVFAAIILIFFLFAAGWYYYTTYMQNPKTTEALPVNYLIKGVPYYGFYQRYFPNEYNDPSAESTLDSSVKSILDYWGDSRFDFPDLKKIFPQILHSFASAESFFKSNGYQTAQLGSVDIEKTIPEIKKYVNGQKRTPVLVLQKRSLDPRSDQLGFRVVIGVSDDEKKITVHDYYFGNNYEISYQDFETMLAPSYLSVLAIWPSEELTGKIKGAPDSQQAPAYPARMEAMDKVGELLAVDRTEACRLFSSFSKSNEAFSLYEGFVNDSNFKYFPPIYQVDLLSYLAEGYIKYGRYDDAIKLIQDNILPINHDLNQNPPEGWYIPSQSKMAYPYSVLTEAYINKGEKNLAKATLEEMKKIAVPPERQEYFDSMISKLEKEISSK